MSDETVRHEETTYDPDEVDEGSGENSNSTTEFENEAEEDPTDESDNDPVGDFREAVDGFRNRPRGQRQGSIWNSPIGLAATVFLSVKVLDLVWMSIIERNRTRRAEAQQS